MKFTIFSLISVAAALLSLSAIQVYSLPTDLARPIVAKEAAIRGLNDYNCKLTPAHPRPVILVHGTANTVHLWFKFAPKLIKRGYCVFGLTYGRHKIIPFLGGLAPIEDSAREMGAFANKVMHRMNASQVDIVGYSQGGILTRYWVKYLDGAGKVYRHIGISPIHHGTTQAGAVALVKAAGILHPDISLVPSIPSMIANSTFMQKLNAGGDTTPGVIESNIATRYDKIVVPWQSCFQHGPNVTNAVLQKLCKFSLDDHPTMPFNNIVHQFILNQLDPSTAEPASCRLLF
ncbi:hypothetical protein BX616_005271 [Lobosporangium transversale]|uniref:Secreted lipase n=1 Tax=Lobosporangium transversale TaxID=64571 RepID=A0A1Y2GHN8_9FUNG|nr:secreted lipase [Lobosporangium transversale]XP_021879071.1 secreted lipase [Lobosporangium transversale]KAF9897614.1 hypothetical protein BX616_005271 [Lobosporangium transversale]ORZ09980.1 secreted lipase [Lobosporangium transversale]ORZ09981.1 secreted lipase [Lobosporangium transversale]|eukprot:XP_021879070.1 secreted lipase [Lobosporangium transversale]